MRGRREAVRAAGRAARSVGDAHSRTSGVTTFLILTTPHGSSSIAPSEIVTSGGGGAPSTLRSEPAADPAASPPLLLLLLLTVLAMDVSTLLASVATSSASGSAAFAGCALRNVAALGLAAAFAARAGFGFAAAAPPVAAAFLSPPNRNQNSSARSCHLTSPSSYVIWKMRRPSSRFTAVMTPLNHRFSPVQYTRSREPFTTSSMQVFFAGALKSHASSGLN